MNTQSVVDLLITRSGRKIANIIPDVVIDEHHTDENTITSHPVQSGAPISDHVYRNPTKLVCNYGWSASSGANLTKRPLQLEGAFRQAQDFLTKDIKKIYQDVLDLKDSRQPFDVSTGKKKYSNMLVKSIELTSDATTENVLMLTIAFVEVLIVTVTQSTQAHITKQAVPDKTASVTNTGKVQPKEVK